MPYTSAKNISPCLVFTALGKEVYKCTVLLSVQPSKKVTLPVNQLMKRSVFQAGPDVDGGPVPALDDADALAAVALHLPREQRRQLTLPQDGVRQQ